MWDPKMGGHGDPTVEQPKAVAVKGKAFGDSLTLLRTVRWCGKIVLWGPFPKMVF